MRSLLAVLLGLAGPACNSSICPDHSGCAALGKPAPTSLGRGVAGAVANQSDLILGECQAECGFAEAAIRVWRTPAPVTDEAAARALATTPPLTTTTAQSRYQLALDPGDYLVCASAPSGLGGMPCAAVTIRTGVTTINVKTRYGDTGLVVFDEGRPTQRSAEVFGFSPALP